MKTSKCFSFSAKDPALDLLINDLWLGDMEGDELARQVRTLEPDLKVLYLTSHADRLFEANSSSGPRRPISMSRLRERL